MVEGRVRGLHDRAGLPPDPPRPRPVPKSEQRHQDSIGGHPMMAESTPRTPPPLGPDRRQVVAVPPAWNQPTQPLRQQEQHSRAWSPYVTFGGIIVLVGCFAILVAMLAR